MRKLRDLVKRLGGIAIGEVGGNLSFRALRDIVGGDKTVNVTTIIQSQLESVHQQPLNPESPYRGLVRFEERDRGLFFGREEFVKRLLGQLSSSNILLVLGASGSGKSSVVRAGLLPALSTLIGARFRPFIFVPDSNPFESLRSTLHGGGFRQAQIRRLENVESDGPLNVVRALRREGEQWLLFVDQFEEIFTLTDAPVRKEFIDALLAISKDPGCSTKLVLAMRADFLDRFSSFPEFAKIIERNIDIVADMQVDELRLAIEQPAARHGVVFEQGLVDEIIQGVQGQPGSLPLLQYSLNLLWEEEARHGGVTQRRLRAQTYRGIGGVRGALRKRADEIYAAFGDDGDFKKPSAKQEVARRIFLRLVDIADTRDSTDAVWRPVRRRAPIAQFAPGLEREILQDLVNEKLLVSNRENSRGRFMRGDPVPEAATVEVAHEALFTCWDRLKEWIEGRKQVIFFRNRLGDDALRWRQRQFEDPEGADEELLGGSRLAQALDIRERGDFDMIFGGLDETETEFLNASDVARERRAREDQTLHSIAEGFITIDTVGSVLTLNRVAEYLTGWPRDQASGQPLATVFQIFSERNRKRCSHAIQRIVEIGVAEGLDGPTLMIAKDGSERLVESNAAPIRDRSNRRIGAVVVFRDVTEKRRLDEERQKADKLESLGLVAGGIAHDFNNLLTSILGNISLALLQSLDPEAVERLSSAKRATNRAQVLAQQLLTFARGGAPIKQTTSLGQLLRDTLSLSLHGSKVRTEYKIDKNLWPVDIDPGQISQVINNLVVNADQAMPAGGVLRVLSENFQLAADSVVSNLRAGRWVKFSIQDEGIGIPEEYLKKIFDPYFTTKPKGSGLGLATAYSIVKNHFGLIAVDSKPGEGSTFTISLPASEHELPEEENAGPVPTAPGPARVLVLDDEEAICMLVTCALEPLGYEVTETNDGTQAIDAHEKAIKEGRPYDIFIFNLTIPGGMGGQETIQRLLKIDPGIRAIVSSGYANDPVMSQHGEYGFSGMIAKPYEIDALGRKVAEVLASPPPKRA